MRGFRDASSGRLEHGGNGFDPENTDDNYEEGEASNQGKTYEESIRIETCFF
jgi:hypothetical protein